MHAQSNAQLHSVSTEDSLIYRFIPRAARVNFLTAVVAKEALSPSFPAEAFSIGPSNEQRQIGKSSLTWSTTAGRYNSFLTSANTPWQSHFLRNNSSRSARNPSSRRPCYGLYGLYNGLHLVLFAVDRWRFGWQCQQSQGSISDDNLNGPACWLYLQIKRSRLLGDVAYVFSNYIMDGRTPTRDSGFSRRGTNNFPNLLGQRQDVHGMRWPVDSKAKVYWHTVTR